MSLPLEPGCFGSVFLYDKGAKECVPCRFNKACVDLSTERLGYLRSRGKSAADIRSNRRRTATAERVRRHRAAATGVHLPPIAGEETLDLVTARRAKNFDEWIICPPAGTAAMMRQITKHRSDILRVATVVEELRRDLGRAPRHPEVSIGLANLDRPVFIRVGRVRQLRKSIEKLEVFGWSRATSAAPEGSQSL